MTTPSEPVLLAEEENTAADMTSVSRGRLVLRRFFRRKMGVLGLFVVLLLVFLAFVGPHLTQWNYTEFDVNNVYSPPSSSHWFGTNDLGQDMFARTMRGLQKSIFIGLIGAVISTGVAGVLGAIAGYFGRATDRAVVVLIDLLLILPSFLIIAVTSPLFVGKPWLIFVVLLAAFQWMLTARVVRGLTQSLKEREFVSAARFMGVPARKIIARHILPNMASFLIIDATVNVSSLILAEVALSYFGFGIRPPDVSLGSLIGQYANNADTYPWLFWIPSTVLVVLVLAVNLVGDGLRDALDPNSAIS
ncbi:MAG TPA: ABC transporter permease [Micromonosporaceae bacterium]|nr:ABC transporter permease [Micromonosporaceae bacterium]